MPQSKSRPLKWHGGKRYLAQWIISHMPPHLHYVEPYFGGGQVLFARDVERDWLFASGGASQPAHRRGASEVVNDVNGELTNFWQCLQDPETFEAMTRRLSVTPFSEDEWDRAAACPPDAPPVDRAVAFFIRYRQSRQGLGKDFATVTRNRTRGRINEQANAWLGVIEGLPDAHQRLRGVLILNHDAVAVIRQQDGEHTLFYCDPPYLHETRFGQGKNKEYEFEMTAEDHERLLECLASIKGHFLLSGYRSTLYDQFAERHGWRRLEKQIDNKASVQKTKESKTECLWTNAPE